MQECINILKYDEKTVVAIARLQQKIAELNELVENMILGAWASNIKHNDKHGKAGIGNIEEC